jgi:peptide/nickel transport system permease protein
MAIAPPPLGPELPSAPLVPVTSRAAPKGESYWDLVWHQYRRNRLAVVSSLFVLALFLVAIGAPFLAGNRPIVFRGSYPGVYQDTFEEWKLGGHPEFMAALQSGTSGGQAERERLNVALRTVERQLESLASQLPGDQAARLRDYGDAYRAAISSGPEGLERNFQNISDQFDPDKVTMEHGLYWPVLSSLGTRDIFFMTLVLLVLLLPIVRRLLPHAWTDSLKARFLVVALPAVALAFLWMIPRLQVLSQAPYLSVRPPVFDTLDYKQQLFTGEIQNSFALFPPVQFGINEDHLEGKFAPPSALHWLGTDGNGRDLLTRMIWGSRISLSVGFVAVAIYVAIGILVGTMAGYFRGWVDLALSRIIEVVICFPAFFLMLAVLAFLQPSMWNIMVVIGITGWTTEARLVRGEFLRLHDQEFVLAAKGLGVSDGRIIFRHILPNGLAPLLVSASFGIASAILIESSLSFLGFGISIPVPSWGGILNEARESFRYWWITIFPGLAIFSTVTAYNLIGEGVRDAIDPRLKI